MARPSALKTRMPAALVPDMWLPDMVPPTVPCPGWCASPIAPCAIWNSFSPPVSSGSDTPAGRRSPMFSNTLLRIVMFAMSAMPSFWMAAWHVWRNSLFSTRMLPRSSLFRVRISTSGAPYPGRQSVSSNAMPRIVTLSASTSMREYPVNTTSPGIPVSEVSVSGFVMSRTVSSYVPAGTVTVAPPLALSMRPCRSDFGSASITYACGDHSGSA